MRSVILALLMLAGCGEAGPADLGPATKTFVLDAGAFPRAAWPSVVVYVPGGFHVEKPVNAVIWLRGLYNCATNVVRDQNGECTPDGGAREAFQLAAQFEASGRNALLIVPELSYDSTSNDPGQLAAPGGLRAFLAETLADLTPQLGPLGVGDLAPVIVAAHSAAWRSSAAILQSGGVAVSEVWELDALYDDIPTFVDWIRLDVEDFEGVPPRRRFADVYTDETAANSVNMAETAEIDWLPDAGAVLDDRGTDEVTDDALRIGLIFKRSPLSHLDVARVWFLRLLATSQLPAR
jgi:hypothetical protein